MPEPGTRSAPWECKGCGELTDSTHWQAGPDGRMFHAGPQQEASLEDIAAAVEEAVVALGRWRAIADAAEVVVLRWTDEAGRCRSCGVRGYDPLCYVCDLRRAVRS